MIKCLCGVLALTTAILPVTAQVNLCSDFFIRCHWVKGEYSIKKLNNLFIFSFLSRTIVKRGKPSRNTIRGKPGNIVCLTPLGVYSIIVD